MSVMKVDLSCSPSDMCDIRLPLRHRRDLHSAGILHGVKWHFLTDDLEQLISPIFNGPLKVGPVDSEMSVKNYHCMQCNITEKCRSQST
jgi:hypothetical protein